MTGQQASGIGSQARRRSFTVAIVGPDGAGKSSVAKRLVHELPIPATYLYMGVNAASGNRLLPTTVIRERLRGRAGGPAADTALPDGRTGRGVVRGIRSLFRVANLLAEESYRQGIAAWNVWRGRVVIFDRHYFLDYYASDIKNRHASLPRRLHGLFLARVLPRPDLVIYLDAPAAVLFARKGEGTIDSLERMRRQYLEVGQRFRHFEVVDATVAETAVVDGVKRRILAFGDGSPEATELPGGDGGDGGK